MSLIKFEITIDNQQEGKEFTKEDIISIRNVIQYRLQGYTTEIPEAMKNCKMNLQYIIVDDKT